MLGLYKKLFGMLDRRERVLTFFVLVLMLAVAIFEAIGIASIMPFVAVLANPGVVETNRLLSAAYEKGGFASTDAFLFSLGVLFLVLIVGSLAFRAFAFWVQIRFSQKRNYAWSCRLVATYLNRPYHWFLNRHTGTLGTSILDEVNKTTFGSLLPSLQLISNALVTVLVVALLLIVDPWLASTVAAVLGGAYTSLYFAVRVYVARIGGELLQANRQRYRLVNEMFGGIKDVKMYGLEPISLSRFQKPTLAYTQRLVRSSMLSEFPSFAMQAVVFGGILVVLLYFMGTRGGLEEALPVFSLYALAGYRLMPALQAMYRDASSMRFHSAILNSLANEFASAEGDQAKPHSVTGVATEQKSFAVSREIRLNGISYRYPGCDGLALDGISVTIPAFSTVGIVGKTGSGKTTLVDVILGLLVPAQGQVVVDGTVIDENNRKSWRRSIGYVPQQIFLGDETIAGNIAFGMPEDLIDERAVVHAAKLANLHDFVLSLKDGYDTRVGERGVKLSGGQRQRIGIARALYRDPDVLVMDEATSALDNLTEKAVMEAVQNIGRRKTIVLVAHRLGTVKGCDQIFHVEHGALVGTGTYPELLAGDTEFRKIAGSAN